MKLETIPGAFTVCQLREADAALLNHPFTFLSRTDAELSLVCPTELTPAETVAREDEWKGFRISGVLDFALIGILAPIAAILAENRIGIFAVSTYNTDYVFVKAAQFDAALAALAAAGYEIT